jgi:HSP20 family molecular chaperone IbpA
MPNMVLTTRRSLSGHDARRDPFAAFDAVIRQAFPPSPRWTIGRIPAPFAPAAEIVKDGRDALVRVELPGVDLASDVSVEVDRGRLVIRGERRDERSGDGGARVLREMRYGSFRRAFVLPERIDADAISASYDAGVLTVRVSGAYDTPEPRTIPVMVSSASVTGSAAAVGAESSAEVETESETEPGAPAVAPEQAASAGSPSED